MGRYRAFQAASFAVMAVGMAAAVILCGKLLRSERETFQKGVQAQASHVATRVRQAVNWGFDPLIPLGALWLQPGAASKSWSDVPVWLARVPGLRAVSAVGPDGIEKWSARLPESPRSSAIPLSGTAREVWLAARARRAPALSDVFASPQGRPSFHVCMPASGPPGTQPSGYIFATYEVQPLIEAGVEWELTPDYSVSVRSRSQVIYSSPPLRNYGGIVYAHAPIALPDREWTLDLGVSARHLTAFRTSILTVAATVGALLYSFGMLLYLSQRRSSGLQRANAQLSIEAARRERSESETAALNQELRRRVDDFESLLNVIPIGIAVADDPECRSIRINPALAEAFGATSEAAGTLEMGRALATHRVFSGDDELTPEQLPMRVAAATGKPVVGQEVRIERPNGSSVYLLNFAAPLFDDQRRVRGALNACVDITGRKERQAVHEELERRLRKAERMRGLAVMAAGIAHDFNNLLTTIIGEAAIALRYLAAEHASERHIRNSLSAAERAAHIVRQVMAFTGNAFYHFEPVDLGRLLESMQPDLVRALSGVARLRFHIPQGLPLVIADPAEVRLAVEQLLRNAIEATEAAALSAGQVEIRVEDRLLEGEDTTAVLPDGQAKPGRYVCIEVRDTAGGMPLDVADRAFDPFFSTRFLGRGLGLSEVLGIVRAHRGVVRLRSECKAPVQPWKCSSPSPVAVEKTSRRRQQNRLPARDHHRVLVVRRKALVRRLDRPSVALKNPGAAARGNDRFDGDHQPFRQPRAEAGIVVVGNAGRFVNGASHAVSAQFPHHLESAAVRLPFHRAPYVEYAVAASRRLCGQVKRAFRAPRQRRRVRAHRARGYRHRRVREVAVLLRHQVQLDQVPCADPPLSRYAVDGLLVHADAQRAREVVHLRRR